MSYLDILIDKLDKVYRANKFHIKRGFRINDSTPLSASNHLIEEVVELQAEIITGNSEKILEEAADVLLLFLHNLHHNNLKLEDVSQKACKKTDITWVNSESEVITKTPGFNRSNR